jgi:small conductance mechanosensitive channel
MDLALAPPHLDRLADIAWTWTAAFLPRLVAAVVILVIGTLVARWASRAVYDISRRTPHIDPTPRPVLASMIRYAVLILVLIVALSQVGIKPPRCWRWSARPAWRSAWPCRVRSAT